MSYKAPFTVLGAGNSSLLQGIVLAPHGPSKGNILFTQGIGGNFEDYMPLLEVLADEYTVATWNQRGHASNQDRFSAEMAAADTALVRRGLFGSTPYIAIGHSMGACINTQALQPKAHIYINPLINTKHLTIPLRALARVSSSLPRAAREGIDDALISTGAVKAFEHLNRPAATYAELEKMDLTTSRTGVPVLYFQSDADEMFVSAFGKSDSARVEELQEIVCRTAPRCVNGSYAVGGLNHCWNRTPYDFAPFFKEEEGKDRNPAFDAIFSFLERYR